MTTGYLLQQALNALPLGAVYGLLACAYVMIHAVTRRINLVFGALAVWAGYTTINTTILLMLANPGETLGPVAGGAALGLAHTVLLGAILERTTARPLYRESSLAMLVTTLGAAIVVEEVLRLANNSHERWLPPILPEPIVLLQDTSFTVHVGVMQVILVTFALILAGSLIALIAHHPFGRLWRACADDPTMAALCGVDLARTVAISFAIASLLAGAGGVLLALNYGVASYYGGFAIGLKTLFVAVVGGLRSLPGVLIAGFLLAAFEVGWSAAFGLEYRDAAAFLALTALMLAFPEGVTSARTTPAPP